MGHYEYFYSNFGCYRDRFKVRMRRHPSYFVGGVTKIEDLLSPIRAVMRPRGPVRRARQAVRQDSPHRAMLRLFGRDNV